MPENQTELQSIHKVVLDTNVLVSSLITINGHPSDIIRLIGIRRILPCYNAEILDEYRRVLCYPKFAFTPYQVESLVNGILERGMLAETIKSTIKMIDESDRKFYDLHKATDAILITGNIKHFPKENTIMPSAAFMEYILR
jgi:putative PIN family toxin of toxin-antitoxin system